MHYWLQSEYIYIGPVQRNKDFAHIRFALFTFQVPSTNVIGLRAIVNWENRFSL